MAHTAQLTYGPLAFLVFLLHQKVRNPSKHQQLLLQPRVHHNVTATVKSNVFYRGDYTSRDQGK